MWNRVRVVAAWLRSAWYAVACGTSLAALVLGAGCSFHRSEVGDWDLRPSPTTAPPGEPQEAVGSGRAEAAGPSGSRPGPVSGVGNGAACTVAVLAAASASDPGSGSFNRLWDAVTALGPRRVLLLGRLEAGAGSEVLAAVQDARAGESEVDLYPGTPGAEGTAPEAIECSRATLLLMSGEAWRQDASAQLAWLRERASAVPASGCILLLLDEPLWERAPETWRALCAELGACPGAGQHVIAAGTGRFSWWSEGRLQVHTLGVPARGQGNGLAPTADGAFAGLLWISIGPGGESVHVLDAAGLAPPEAFARRYQEEREKLRAACGASPITAADGVTEVQCLNPTDEPLAFAAEWRFEGIAGRAEPQMLGFTLDSRQSYRQRFSLRVDGGVPLKFAAPHLLLSTVCRDGVGRPVPVNMELVPAVCMGGQVAVLAEPVAVDGDIRDWPCAGYPLNHASQVVLAREPWQGADDLAATLYVAESAGGLHLALVVQFREGHEAGCSLLLDPRGGAEGGVFDARQGPLVVTVAPEGRVTVEAVHPEAVAAAWRPARGGGTLEATIAAGAFTDRRLPDRVLLEAVLTRCDLSDRPVTVLCFSGDGRGRQSSELYARFARASAGAAASLPAAGAVAWP